MIFLKIQAEPSRCGKTIKQKMLNEIQKRLSEQGYKYYYDSTITLEEALEKERKYRMNCSDFEKDLSPEATTRRIIMFLKGK